MSPNSIQIITDQNYFFSIGFVENLGYEFKVNNTNIGIDDCYTLFQYIYDYLNSSQTKISNNESMAYYSWIIQFKDDQNGSLEVFELDPLSQLYIEGLKISSSILKLQIEICNSYNVSPNFPVFGNFVAISKGVYGKSDIVCVRYPTEDNNCGWYITSEEYDGNYKSMMVEHYSHFILNHFDLIKYVALPVGFVISKTQDLIEISFDETLLDD